MMEKRTYICTDYHTIEELVKKLTGFDYNIPAEEEIMNDVYLVANAKKETLSSYELELIEKGEFAYQFHPLMTHLRNHDVIEEGDYLIEVCW